MVYFSQLQHHLPQKKKSRKRTLKIAGIIASVLAALLIAGYILLFIPGQRVYRSAQELVQHGTNIKAAIDAQNLSELSKEIEQYKISLDTLTTEYQYFLFLDSIPLINEYYRDGTRALRASAHGVVAAQILVDGLKPFSDVLGFQEASDTSDLAAEEKLAYIVGVMPQVMASIDGAKADIVQLKNEVDHIDPNRYPRKLGKYEPRTLIQNVHSTIDSIVAIIEDNRPVFDILPKALGQTDVKTYLILFQNDKELRPTGGFITAYALVKFDKGRFSIIKSDDIYNLDSGKSYLPLPNPIRDYLGVNSYFMRDTNFTPDFKTSMKDFEVYYEKLTDVPEIDGIIALDTEFVKEFLNVLGPIHLSSYGETFDADNVVYQLELYSEKLLSGSTRKALLGELMQEMIRRVFETKKEKWKPLIETGMEEAQQKHVLFYFHDDNMQQFVEKNRYASKIENPSGDYLHINDANLGGLKSDMYVTREASLVTTIASDGTVQNALTITYTNPQKFDGWLNARTRDYVRVYVPQGSKLLDYSGGEIGTPEVYDELGKTVFTNFTRTYPAGLGQPNSQTITFTYELPFKVDKTVTNNYDLLIQKQPGLFGPAYKITVNGQTQEFNLETDRALTFSL